MTCSSVLNFFTRGISYFRLGLGNPLGRWLGVLLTSILVLTFFGKGVVSFRLGFGTPLGSQLGAFVTSMLALHLFERDFFISCQALTPYYGVALGHW